MVKPAGPVIDEQRTYTERVAGGLVLFFTCMVMAPLMVWLFSVSVTVLMPQLSDVLDIILIKLLLFCAYVAEANISIADNNHITFFDTLNIFSVQILVF